MQDVYSIHNGKDGIAVEIESTSKSKTLRNQLKNLTFGNGIETSFKEITSMPKTNVNNHLETLKYTIIQC